MAKQPLPLTAYTEDQRVQAHERFVLIRPFLEEGVPLTQIAEAQHLPLRTARRWVGHRLLSSLTYVCSISWNFILVQLTNFADLPTESPR